MALKVATPKRTSPCDIVPETSSLKSLHKGTGGRDLSQEQFTDRVLRNNSQGKPKKTKNGAKMASSHDGTCPRDLLEQLAARLRTSTLVCSNLNTCRGINYSFKAFLDC